MFNIRGIDLNLLPMGDQRRLEERLERHPRAQVAARPLRSADLDVISHVFTARARADATQGRLSPVHI